MEHTSKHKGYQLKRRPREYPRLPQQQKFLDALEFCAVKKGISKRELQEKMVNCIPRYYKEHKDDNKDLHSETLRPMSPD